jgi:hypothetical protein
MLLLYCLALLESRSLVFPRESILTAQPIIVAKFEVQRARLWRAPWHLSLISDSMRAGLRASHSHPKIMTFQFFTGPSDRRHTRGTQQPFLP